MRRLFPTIAILFLTAVVTMAKEPYFCVTPGCVQYYERNKVKGGKLTQTTLFEIESARNNAGGKVVSYYVTMKKAGGAQIFGGRTPLTVEIDADGTTHMDFGASVRSFIKNIFKDAEITCSGSAAVLPADMKPGDTLPEAHCVLTAGILKLTIDVTSRQVLRYETITTPAGTFDCVVAREHKVEDGPMHHYDRWSQSWYAPGVGYVRHDVLDKNMEAEYSEILISREFK
jgi:hypothetical protein